MLAVKLFFISLFFITAVQAQNINIVTTGTCREFTVAVFSADLKGCYDIKIDAPGLIRNGDDSSSSYYYAENAFCNGYGNVDFLLLSDDTTNAKLKLRSNDGVYEKDFVLYQFCEEDDSAAVAALASALIILSGVVFYLRK